MLLATHFPGTHQVNGTRIFSLCLWSQSWRLRGKHILHRLDSACPKVPTSIVRVKPGYQGTQIKCGHKAPTWLSERYTHLVMLYTSCMHLVMLCTRYTHWIKTNWHCTHFYWNFIKAKAWTPLSLPAIGKSSLKSAPHTRWHWPWQAIKLWVQSWVTLAGNAPEEESDPH